MDEPTEEELMVLAKFRNQLSDLDLNRFILGDMHLIRFLRARSLNIPKAELMLRKHMEWRKDNEIDTILENPISQEFRDEYRYEVSGLDKDDCAIIIVSYNEKWDFRKVIETFGKKECYRMSNFYCEEVYALAKKNYNGKNFLGTGIGDLERFSFHHFASVEVMDMLITCVRTMEANYPDCLNVGFLVNAPKIFCVLWEMVKPFLSEITLRKIHIMGQDTEKIRAALLTQMPIDKFPPKYGGTFISSFNSLNVSYPMRGVNFDDSNVNDNFPAAMKKLIEVAVGAGEKVNLCYDVEVTNTNLSWAFETNNFDIGFSLKCEDTDEDIVLYKRLASNKKKQIGSLICNKTGCYSLCFDNTYSRMRSKILHYAVVLTIPSQKCAVEINGNEI